VKGALASIQVASRRGLEERFDGSVGGGTVLAPRGGIRQLTPAEASVHLLPADGDVETASIMSVGFDPDLSSLSPFRGGQYALIEALSRMTAAGGSWRKARFSLQEYFGRTDRGPEAWGAPLAALLGALTVQRRWALPAIGGKDSMSGSFEELDVPPTIIAFAAAAMEARRASGAAIPAAGLTLALVGPDVQTEQMPGTAAPDFDALAAAWDWVEGLGARGHLKAAGSVGRGGWACKALIMALGNGFGIDLCRTSAPFLPVYGNLIVVSDLGRDELAADAAGAGASVVILGRSIRETEVRWPGGRITLEEAQAAWEGSLAGVWPEDDSPDSPVDLASPGPVIRESGRRIKSKAVPRVCIPVFPGTNGEDDARRAFGRWGAESREHVFLKDDTASLARAIVDAQILYVSGGFSAGDEPDGAGKYIAAVLRQPRVADAILSLLERGGLVLGICNGFQALIKSGWLINGKAGIPGSGDPTLTRNRIGRHAARVVQTVATGVSGPWLTRISRGDIHSVPVSHGEGRFIAPQAVLDRLNAEGRIAFQYCDVDGLPSMAGEHNPNGSMMAVEGIVSPCGRILGKMGHSERWREGTFIDVPGMEVEQPLIAGGVEWFR
jgi:phosphoribosylformylglycinamidine synthase